MKGGHEPSPAGTSFLSLSLGLGSMFCLSVCLSASTLSSCSHAGGVPLYPSPGNTFIPVTPGLYGDTQSAAPPPFLVGLLSAPSPN